MDYNAEVDRIFRKAHLPRSCLCENPVTGGKFVRGVDPIKPQKERAERALRARDWFASHASPDAPPLPLSYGDREDLKRGGLPHIVAWFARSLEARAYDYHEHPSFDDYARGVLASADAPEFITKNEELRRRFPPHSLEGLDGSLYWEPPENGRKRCHRRARPRLGHRSGRMTFMEPKTIPAGRRDGVFLNDH
jgi:hypothetical protein